MQVPTGRHGRWHDLHFLANHPGLDFVNTVSERVAGVAAGERLETLHDLATWAASAGLLPPDRMAGAADDAGGAARARALREAGHAVLAARQAGDGADPQALALLFGEAARGFAAGALAWRPGEAAPAALRTDADALVGLCALQLLDVLFRLPPGRVRACPGCGWMFHDVTRGGRRRWCRMDDCGNREKARRHRGRAGATRLPS